MITYYRRSDISGDFNGMDLPISQEKLKHWCEIAHSPNRPLIQEFFPELNNDQREFILTGITPAEWDEYLREEDDTEYGEHRDLPLR